MGAAQQPRLPSAHSSDAESKGDPARVESKLLDYVAAHPEDATAIRSLGEMRKRQGKFDQAEALFQRVLKLAPNQVESGVELAIVELQLRKFSDADSTLGWLENKRITQEQRFAIAEANVKAHRPKQALEWIGSKQSSPLALSIACRSFAQLHDVDRLRSTLPAVIAARNLRVAVDCSEAMRAAKLTKAAQSALEAVPNGQRSDQKYLASLIESRLASGDLKAATHTAAILQRYPAIGASAQLTLAKLALVAGDPATAAHRLRALRVGELFPDERKSLIALEMRVGDTGNAVEDARSLHEQDPADNENTYLVGASLLQAGDFSRAEAELTKYTELVPLDALGHLALGLALTKQENRSGEARKQFEQASELDPGDAEANFQLALLLKEAGDTTAAATKMEKVLLADPGHVRALQSLATLRAEAGEIKQSSELLQRAVKLEPRSPELHFQLSRMYQRLGQDEAARQQLAIFQKLRHSQQDGDGAAADEPK